MQPVGTRVYELADGTIKEYPFGLVEIAFFGEITAGRVIFLAQMIRNRYWESQRSGQ